MIYIGAGNSGAAHLADADLDVLTASKAALWLDLRPPDPPGSRVDGLDVGLRILGWEPGDELPVVPTATSGVMLYVGGLWYSARGSDIATAVPALAAIDPADPLALRLAVAAVLRGRGGR